MPKRKVVAHVVSIDGEIHKDIYEGDKVKTTRQKSCDYLRDTIELNKYEGYVKAYTRSLFEVCKVLSGSEVQFLNYLTSYIRYTTGILAHDNGRKLTRHEMSSETGIEIRSVDRILSKLIEKQVLGKHKTGHDICFTVNPYIFMKGSRVNITLMKMFENSKWAKLFK